MTNLKNETWIMKKYDEICKTNPREYGMVSLKIKRLRIFNRLFGRKAGDLLIQEVLRVLETCLKEGEYIALISPGYYNMLVRLPNDYDAIFKYIIDLNAKVRDCSYESTNEKVFLGMGVFLLTDNPPEFYTAQYNADICRVECPENQLRNSHLEVYGLSYKDTNLNSYNMEKNFWTAMDNNHFKLYLQPKVDLRTGTITQAEALVRWVDPVKGMIPLDTFLPELEKNGLIGDLDMHMFGLVCKTIKSWLERYQKKIKISVNLSRNMFEYRYFTDLYKPIYEKHPCPKDCIDFELLESIVLNQVDKVQNVVEQLKNFGFTCSLDDFGSGYSSFSVLTSTSLESLKIDRSLFTNEADPRERAIIRHIIATAKDLNIKVVAEGVETRGYVDFLKELDCDYIQGFIFYKPMEVEEFEKRFLINEERAQL